MIRTHALLGLLLIAAIAGRAQAAPPNILFLHADDQRPDTIAALGNPAIRTPTLDALAARGLSFQNAYNFGGNSTYHATKAAVSMLSRQLRIDAFGKRVRVTEICPGRVATDIFAHVHGDSAETYEKFVKGFELPQAADIADTIAFAIAAPVAVNIGHIEITPTLQVPGGLQTTRPAAARA